MKQHALARTQLELASLAVLRAGGSGWWSWRTRDQHGLIVALSLVLITGVSSILLRLATREPRDRSA